MNIASRFMRRLILAAAAWAVLSPVLQAQCDPVVYTSAGTASGSGFDYSFNQFDQSLGALTSVTIQYGYSSSAYLTGQNCGSCSNLRGVYCGYEELRWPGNGLARWNWLTCRDFALSTGGSVSGILAGGVDGQGQRSLSSASEMSPFIGSGQVGMHTSSDFDVRMLCASTPCPPPPIPATQAACANVSPLTCFAVNGLSRTSSTVVTITYRYQPGLAITTQPVSRAACTGGGAEFTVSAEGVGTPTYQWVWQPTGGGAVLLSDGVVASLGSVSGTHTDHLSVSGITATGGIVRCTVNNGCGIIGSANARLYVNVADQGRTGGVAGADGQLDNNDFIVFIDNFFAHRTSADIGIQGGLFGTDGAFDNNDFIAFVNAFFLNCS